MYTTIKRCFFVALSLVIGENGLIAKAKEGGEK